MSRPTNFGGRFRQYICYTWNCINGLIFVKTPHRGTLRFVIVRIPLFFVNLWFALISVIVFKYIEVRSVKGKRQNTGKN